MQNKDKYERLEVSPLDMFFVIFLERATIALCSQAFIILPFLERIRLQILIPYITKRKITHIK